MRVVRPGAQSLPGGELMRAARKLTPGREDGIALIAVLWLTILLTVIASGFAFSMHGEAVAAHNALSLAQARAAADGAIERTAFELARPRNLPDVWRADGSVQTWSDGEIQLKASAVDESARIDLNVASDALLKGLLQNVGGLDAFAADSVLAAIQDWRDADDLKRPNGAEEADYRAAGKTYKPSNAPFQSVGELARVLGMTQAVFQRIAPIITVYSRQPGVNAATAGRDVLLALPNATPDAVDAYIDQRTQALANKLPVPPFPPAQAFGSGAAAVWRIRAQASLPDGVTFVREAVLRPSPDAQRPLIALAWLEPSRSVAVPSLSSPAPDGRHR